MQQSKANSSSFDVTLTLSIKIIFNSLKGCRLKVLVEYDDVEWQRREWVHVYRGQVFQIFLLERTLAWATRKHPTKIRAPPVLWPALVYIPLVDQAGISEHKYRPVEYLVDRSLDYHDYSQVQPYQVS
ncbi:hypothetical protein SK128_020975 [Halocaridina rubra]|uniref:Lysine-specific demethylase 3B PWWP domain-containing protein n=1 Tax=Halocaridina rubra TaxID=373956 RepID=A0AAN8X1B5_HALRR